MTDTTKEEMRYLLPDQDTSKGWIGVDLDGTLAEYDGWHGPAHIGKPIVSMVDRVKAWLAEGRDVRIFTARVDGGEVPGSPDGCREVEEITRFIQDWCQEHLGKVLPVTCKKDFGMAMLWDDLAVTVVKNSGKPWAKALLEELLEAEANPRGWRGVAIKLWELLDDIDTLDDACRENDVTFRAQTRRIVQRRTLFLESRDGQTLVPGELMKNPSSTEEDGVYCERELRDGAVLKIVFSSDDLSAILVPLACQRLRLAMPTKGFKSEAFFNPQRLEASVYVSLDSSLIEDRRRIEEGESAPGSETPSPSAIEPEPTKEQP